MIIFSYFIFNHFFSFYFQLIKAFLVLECCHFNLFFQVINLLKINLPDILLKVDIKNYFSSLSKLFNENL